MTELGGTKGCFAFEPGHGAEWCKYNTRVDLCPLGGHSLRDAQAELTRPHDCSAEG